VFDLPWEWVAPALILALGAVVLVSAVRGLNRTSTTEKTDELDQV